MKKSEMLKKISDFQQDKWVNSMHNSMNTKTELQLTIKKMKLIDNVFKSLSLKIVASTMKWEPHKKTYVCLLAKWVNYKTNSSLFVHKMKSWNAAFLRVIMLESEQSQKLKAKLQSFPRNAKDSMPWLKREMEKLEPWVEKYSNNLKNQIHTSNAFKNSFLKTIRSTKRSGMHNKI